MPRPGSGPLSGIVRGMQAFMQTKQFYEQMESTNLQQEATRAQLAAFKQQQADYMSPDEKAQWERDQLGPNAVAQGAAGVAAAPYTVRANNIGTQGQIDFNKGLGAPAAGPGQVGQYDPYTGKTGLVEDPNFDAMTYFMADEWLKKNPEAAQYYTKEPVAGMGHDMVRLVPKPGAGRSVGYGSPGMELGRNVRALLPLDESIYNVTDDINATAREEWDAKADADWDAYEGKSFTGVNPSDIHGSTHEELRKEWIEKGTIAKRKIKIYLLADYKLFGPNSTHTLWVTALSNRNYNAFKSLQTAIREMYDSGMNEKQIDDYLDSKRLQYPEVQYRPYETLQTSNPNPLQTERNEAVRKYGPLRNE